MNEDRIYFTYNGSRVYLYVHQVQHLVNGIGTEHPDNEHRNLLEMFIGDNNSEEARKAKVQEDLMKEKIDKDIE